MDLNPTYLRTTPDGLSHADDVFSTYVSIHSQHRAQVGSTSSTSQNFTIQLATPVKDVIRIRPMDVTIANAQHIVDAHNNKLDVTVVGSSLVTVTLTVGNYTTAQFATMLKTVLDAGATGTWTVTDNNSSGGPNTFTIANDTAEFTFNFSTGPNASGATPAPLLGFRRSAEATSSSQTITSALSYDLSGARAILVRLEANGRNVSNIDGSHEVGSYFCRVPLDVTQTSIKHLNFAHTRYLERETVRSGYGRVTEFHVRLVQEDGQDYNMNGVDWSMGIELISSGGVYRKHMPVAHRGF